MRPRQAAGGRDPVKVYRDLDQAGLDREYNARATVPDVEPYLARYAAESARMRAALPCHLDVAYGPTPEETLDIFPAAGPRPAPTMVFVHGGYWRLLGKGDSSFMAEAFTGAGATLVAVNYALAPRVTLDEIVRQVRAAVAWLHREGKAYGVDPERIHAVGSSAGGHLTAMLLCPGWPEDLGVHEDVVKGACVISGLFDLEPVRLCHPNEWARLDAEGARRLSPIHHLPAHGCPLIVAWAETDTGEFKRQSQALAEAWAGRGFPCARIELAGFNHFDIVLELNRAASPLTAAILHQMGLSRAGTPPPR